MADRAFIDVAGGPVEYEYVAGADELPTLVFLHEGLGSIDLWRGVPDAVRSGLRGRHPSLVYARHGYGASAPSAMPRPASYMHREADVVLPQLLAAFGIERRILVGHSDGASIALLFAGAGGRVDALVCLAPHVFVEPESIAGIETARDVFAATDMVDKMARYHADPEATFRGWNDVWLSPEFRDWNITERLPHIDVPLLLVQGDADQYGTFAQLDAIEGAVAGPVEQLRVPGAGHAPHIDARDDVVGAIVRFVDRVERLSAGRDPRSGPSRRGRP